MTDADAEWRVGVVDAATADGWRWLRCSESLRITPARSVGWINATGLSPLLLPLSSGPWLMTTAWRSPPPPADDDPLSWRWWWEWRCSTVTRSTVTVTGSWWCGGVAGPLRWFLVLEGDPDDPDGSGLVTGGERSYWKARLKTYYFKDNIIEDVKWYVRVFSYVNKQVYN